MNYFLKRLLNDKSKVITMSLIIIIPLIEIIIMIYQSFLSDSIPNPCYSAFLAGSTVGFGHILQGSLLWFLPLYLLIICCEENIQDFKTGNSNILIVEWGRKKYFIFNIFRGFIIGFLIILISLSINLILVHIVFRGGIYTKLSVPSKSDTIAYFSYSHPLITNSVYILITSFLSGLISMTGVALSIVFRKRNIVYPITFLMWYIPCIMPKSLIYVTQPFTEYHLNETYPILIVFAAVNVLATTAMYIKETRYAKI